MQSLLATGLGLWANYPLDQQCENDYRDRMDPNWRLKESKIFEHNTNGVIGEEL